MIRRGKLSKFTHESKFTEKINTKLTAQEAITEGNKLREMIAGKTIHVVNDDYELMNSFRL